MCSYGALRDIQISSMSPLLCAANASRSSNMRSSRKRAQRQRAQADPVARRISANLDAIHIEATNDAENDAVISAAEAGTRRSADSATHVDLAAGAEFIGMQPNENAPSAQPTADASDPLTPE